jgi:biopolymer transport protein ExbB/TolQ
MRLFYDHLVDKTKLVKLIEEKEKDFEKRISLHRMLDELIHDTVLNVIFSHLDKKHHEEFLVLMHKNPRSTELLIYLKTKAHPKIEDKIREEAKKLEKNISSELD